MNTLVVVGEPGLARRAAELVPSYQVMGAEQDADLADPSSGLVRIGSMLDRGNVPTAVLCSASPGFSALSQLRRYPPNRCYVFPGDSPWPLTTLQCLVEATGMTLLEDIESLPVALGGRTVEGVHRPGYEVIPTGSGIEVEEAVVRLKAAQAQEASQPRAGGRGGGADDFGWADATPIQVPPAPVSLDGELAHVNPRVVIDVSDPPAISAGPAYQPTDLLRALRPRAVAN